MQSPNLPIGVPIQMKFMFGLSTQVTGFVLLLFVVELLVGLLLSFLQAVSIVMPKIMKINFSYWLMFLIFQTTNR